MPFAHDRDRSNTDDLGGFFNRKAAEEAKFDDARGKLKQWLVVERMRVAELEFLQGARARIRISPIPLQVAAPAATQP